jgi:hypothetical protein
MEKPSNILVIHTWIASRAASVAQGDIASRNTITTA